MRVLQLKEVTEVIVCRFFFLKENLAENLVIVGPIRLLSVVQEMFSETAEIVAKLVWP